MPSLTKEIPANSDLHKKVVNLLSSRIKLAQKGSTVQTGKFNKAENAILAYVPESDLDAQRRAKRENSGEPKYTTIKLPYTFAVVMAAHTYLTSVFFARSPVHQFAGRHGEPEQQVQALEALVSYQVTIGEMLGPYYLWVYDACKYGVGVVEEYWENEEVQFSQIEEVPDPTDPLGQKTIKQFVQVKMPGYSGNRIGNIRPFDFLPDPRVTVGNYQKGEFVFVRKRLSWETVAKRKAQGYYTNTDRIKSNTGQLAQGGGTGGSQLETPDDNLTLLDTGETKRPAYVEVFEGCVSIIPKEWGLSPSTFHEKWMFTITQDMSTVIGAQPHGAMHCKFPYGVLESEIEAYGTWNRGIPEIVESLQNTLDWLINQHFYNVRAALNNQFLIDPTKVVVKDAEDGGPGFVYRLRPEAFGQDVRSFFYQIPVQDVTSQHVNDMQTVLGIGERTLGINDQILGVLSGGGRKTATEVRTSTGFGVNRLKTIAEYMSATSFMQHSQRLVQNSQQYFSAEKKFKIAGSLLTDMGPQAAQNFINVTPDSIQGFYDFIPVDGTLPVDRLALANLWKELLLQMRTVPGLVLQYDLGKIFAHVAALAGIKNLSQFKIELGSPTALAQEADRGNIVPFSGGGGANPAGVPKPANGATNVPGGPAL